MVAAKILIVEDNTTVAEDARECLEGLGYVVTAIDSSVYLLDRTSADADEKLKEHLGRIRNNVKKSTDIIESLINLSRMEKPKTEKHDLADVVSMSLNSIKIPETVVVHPRFPESASWVEIDPDQIRMALKNLIRNAVQAMDGSGDLTLSIQPCEAGSVELAISDSGPGIPPGNLSKVFDPLFSTKTHGIGFGLSITKMIIENHGGTIRAASEPGSGAVFVVALPRAKKPS